MPAFLSASVRSRPCGIARAFSSAINASSLLDSWGRPWLVRGGLYSALDAYGFWPYMAICGDLTTLIIAAAFAWDCFEARR